MKDCQQGDPLPAGGFTGSVCRRPDLCRSEGRCNFVARMERHLERQEALMPTQPMYPRINWHPGYDGYAWAL